MALSCAGAPPSPRAPVFVPLGARWPSSSLRHVLVAVGCAGDRELWPQWGSTRARAPSPAAQESYLRRRLCSLNYFTLELVLSLVLVPVNCAGGRELC